MKQILVDKRNINEVKVSLIEQLSQADLVGIDLETHGENAIIKYKNYFDVHRHVITGLSLYFGTDCYYFNLNHKDVENRLPWETVRTILEAKKEDAYWLAHNAAFEITNLFLVYGFDLRPKIIDTLQMAVTLYAKDNYPLEKFQFLNFNAIRPLLKDISTEFVNVEYNDRNLTTKQQELLGSFIGKQSNANHSYNGIIDTIAYGHNLKKAVKSFFDYDMETYDQVLAKADAKHMGELTGEQVVSYGCDDAYWCYRLFEVFQKAMTPKQFVTFMNQENPMVSVFSDVKIFGIRANLESVAERTTHELENARNQIKSLKVALKKLLPFPNEPQEQLLRESKWYPKGWQKYRKQVEIFVDLPNDGTELTQINGGISNNITEAKTGVINLSHYMPMQIIFYDLMGLKPIKKDGKITADKEVRGKLLKKCKTEEQKEVLHILNEIARLDQVFKLYLTPYVKLCDPQSKRFYPDITCQLATRRMAMANPNGQQLAKRGDSTYVRSFFLPDEDDHVMLSADFSGIELVTIAQFSKDPYFLECFGKGKKADLHSITTASLLDFTDEEFASINKLPEGTKTFKDLPLVTTDGELLSPAKFKSYLRNNLGKTANFEYWFSGALSGTSDKLGWSENEMWSRVEKYRSTFEVAEEWRLNMIRFAEMNGYVELPDGQKRIRHEVTPIWTNQFLDKFKRFGDVGVMNYARMAGKRIQSRARNQCVNGLVQGTAAALLKRAIKRLIEGTKKLEGVRFIMPIHDEVIFSCPRSKVMEFIPLLRNLMNNDDGDFYKDVDLNTTVSMGRHLEPFKGKSKGQIELDELPYLDFLGEERIDGVATEDEVEKIVEYLFS